MPRRCLGPPPGPRPTKRPGRAHARGGAALVAARLCTQDHEYPLIRGRQRVHSGLKSLEVFRFRSPGVLWTTPVREDADSNDPAYEAVAIRRVVGPPARTPAILNPDTRFPNAEDRGVSSRIGGGFLTRWRKAATPPGLVGCHETASAPRVRRARDVVVLNRRICWETNFLLRRGGCAANSGGAAAAAGLSNGTRSAIERTAASVPGWPAIDTLILTRARHASASALPVDAAATARLPCWACAARSDEPSAPIAPRSALDGWGARLRNAGAAALPVDAASTARERRGADSAGRDRATASVPGRSAADVLIGA